MNRMPKNDAWDNENNSFGVSRLSLRERTLLSQCQKRLCCSRNPWAIVWLLVGLIIALPSVACGQQKIDKPRPGQQPPTAQKPTPTQIAPQALAVDQQEPQNRNVPVDLVVQHQPVIVRAEAYAGRPFGIGKLTFRLREGDEMIARVGAALLTERDNRAFYPVFSKSAVKKFIDNLTGNQEGFPDDATTAWFLFKGDTPLHLTIAGSGTATTRVDVEVARPRRFDRHVRQWWQAFTKTIKEQVKTSDYPPIIETYMMSLVGKRLALDVPDLFDGNKDPLTQTFQLMFDVESLRGRTIRDTMLNGVDQSPANQPVPDPIRWSPLVVNNLPAAIGVEPVAHYVPEECFYLRFGTWGNQIWLQRLMEEFGGNLSRMIQVRGFKYRIQSKFLNQLALQSSEFDRLFGGNLIDDVAVIGMDTYFDDGSAVGVMLHAKATKRLQQNLQNKRAAFAKKNAAIGAKIETIKVGDDTIEFLSTPNNRYRSFYVVSGDCHLVTTSLTIAKRFLESGQGVGSLADSAEFKFARFNMPLERDDTVFIYASTRFFQQLLSPKYQIELRRRNRLITDVMLFELAQLAAANEGRPLDFDNLIREGFLPSGFGYRADGGNLSTVGDQWEDSIRGRRGFFTPIADLSLTSVTAEEATWFRQRANFFSQSIRSLDPIVMAIKRYDRGDKIERVVFDGRLAPFGEEKYGWLMEMFGQPLATEVAPMPNDIIRLQASMRGGKNNPNIPPHQIFAGVQDHVDPNIDLRPSSLFKTLQTLRETPGYIGSWPSAGYTNWLPALAREPDALGYTYSRLLKLWRLQWKGFSIISFDQQRLEALKPNLRVVEAERPAQVRLEIGDLKNSNLRNWANTVNYRRSWQTSVSNVRLLNSLIQQFHVPPESARAVVERMLDVELVCSLDGEYSLVSLPSGRKLWHSTAWPSFSHPELPEEHLAPLLNWFRGLEAQVTKTDTQFSLHGFLDIERASNDTGVLPSFDLFQGFGSFFGGNDADQKKPKSEPKPEPK